MKDICMWVHISAPRKQNVNISSHTRPVQCLLQTCVMSKWGSHSPPCLHSAVRLPVSTASFQRVRKHIHPKVQNCPREGWRYACCLKVQRSTPPTGVELILGRSNSQSSSLCIRANIFPPSRLVIPALTLAGKDLPLLSPEWIIEMAEASDAMHAPPPHLF